MLRLNGPRAPSSDWSNHKHFRQQNCRLISLFLFQFFRQSYPRINSIHRLDVHRLFAQNFLQIKPCKGNVREREKRIGKAGKKASNRCSCSQTEFDVTSKCSDAGNDRMRISTRQKPYSQRNFNKQAVYTTDDFSLEQGRRKYPLLSFVEK